MHVRAWSVYRSNIPLLNLVEHDTAAKSSGTMTYMPALARSIENVPHSRIRELAEVAMSMDGVLRLYFGESNQPTPDYIKQAAISALADGFTFYTANAGLPSLRHAIARYYQRLHG